jgi:uncharacterized membrane protein
MEFPPIPSWDGLHPIIVHFPIGLLLVAPVLLLVGAVLRERGRCWQLAGLVVMLLGTAATFVAVPTGEAAARLADKSPEMIPVLTHHQELAENTRLVFTVLTVLFALLLFVPGRIGKKPSTGALLVVHLVFLAFYLTGGVLLANTGHAGGRLVHEFGVQAMVETSADATTP